MAVKAAAGWQALTACYEGEGHKLIKQNIILY